MFRHTRYRRQMPWFYQSLEHCERHFHSAWHTTLTAWDELGKGQTRRWCTEVRAVNLYLRILAQSFSIYIIYIARTLFAYDGVTECCMDEWCSFCAFIYVRKRKRKKALIGRALEYQNFLIERIPPLMPFCFHNGNVLSNKLRPAGKGRSSLSQNDRCSTIAFGVDPFPASIKNVCSVSTFGLLQFCWISGSVNKTNKLDGTMLLP